MLSLDRLPIPLRFRDRTLASFVVSKATEKAYAAAGQLGRGEIQSLVLSGQTGVGKSHLAAAAARTFVAQRGAQHERLIEQELVDRADEINRLAPWEKFRSRIGQPPGVVWINVPEVITDLRSEIGRPVDGESTAERLAALRSDPDLLVLDDLGREKSSDWTGEAIYVLVNARYEGRLPTIVTTNLTGAELAGSPYWPAISRLAEDGALVRIDAPDHRLQKSATEARAS